MENKFGIKSQGTTVSNNAPVGSAGNPASTDASSVGGSRGRQMPKGKSEAIERRMKRLSDQKKGK